MDINDMTLEDVVKRLEELDVEVREAQEPEAITQAMEEKRQLIERKAELEDLEQRKADAEALANGAEADEVIEEREAYHMAEVRTFAPDTEEYRIAWLKQLAGIPMDAEERAAMATVDVVPTITENTIINHLKENALLKYIDFSTYEGFVNIPNYTTNGDAAWNTSNEQQDVIGHVALSLYQLIKTIEVPGKYALNSIDAFEAKIVEALTNKLEAALQAAVIVGAGAGSSQPTGISVTHSTADGTFTADALSKADIFEIMGTLPAEYQKDAIWIMPNKVFYEAMAVCDLPGFVALNAELKPIIGGKPVVIDDACVISSTDTVFYGCGKAYHLNVSGLSVDRDDSVGFKSGAINYRGLCFADGKLDSADAFVKFTRAETT